MNVIKIMFGTKTISALTALNALLILTTSGLGSIKSIVGITKLLVQKNSIPRPHLLDVLIEARDREATEKQDKIFGVLSVASELDRACGVD